MRKTYEQMIACNCDSSNTLAVIGGKWKLLILHHLLKGTKRFNELSRLLTPVTPHTLSKDLKELIEDGLVEKKVYDQIPPKTEYCLTDKGRELEIILLEIKKFGQKYPIKQEIAD
ncbi:hypothetical protein IGI39_004244 [Enterococcus sp. AZ135]|uniref:winged helix-turn-helix transcriptional regulator n=1 Tax=unclassified Enterococcus TaxID=2608891 RepID=UPI003F297AB9